jgi:hypothetical protein
MIAYKSTISLFFSKICSMKLDELQQIYEQVGERRGWDFSRMKTEREPVP